MWSAEITDLNSVARSVFTPYSLQLIRRLNSYASVTFQVPALDENADQLLIAERAVKLYRNGVLRFYGKIAQPLQDDQEWIQVTAHDPFYFLSKRRLQSDTTFTNIDAGQIAWSLINTQNGRSSTRLQQGTIQASVKRDRTYAEGSVISELITQLAEVDDGFFFTVSPVDGMPGVFGQIEITYPLPGNDAQAAVFGFGDGTVGNLSGYSRVQNLPINRIRAIGVTVGETVLDSYKQDSTSVSRFDIIEDERSFSSVSEQATLDQHALSELDPSPPTTYTMTIIQQSSEGIGGGDPPDLGGILVPALFDDFDVGDTVSLIIKHGRIDVLTTPLVSTAKISVSDEGAAEQLESVFMMEADLS